MSKYRNALPQLAADKLFLTDGGMETDLIFHHGIELPLFSSVSLFREDDAPKIVRDYYIPYINTAKDGGNGFVLESSNWRSSPGWLTQLGIPEDEHEALNRRTITFLAGLRGEFEVPKTPMVISACVGPRGDGYVVDNKMNAEQAQKYHSWQANLFTDTEADMITAMTLNYVEEAIGIARAAKAAKMPVVIGFTVETDGRLPTGQCLGAAIEEVDAASGNYPAYYMINCAHPDHFTDTLVAGGGWVERIKGLRANAARLSHAELDASEVLDDGNPAELGDQYAKLRNRFPALNVFGGCCGTDHRHVVAIAEALSR
jgi:S-methylmethionine-dependent homocysteine/selenocysteine methylase